MQPSFIEHEIGIEMTTRSCITCILLLLAMVPVPAPAQSGRAGSLSGRIVEAGTEVALPGVNVIVDGTTIGGATDTNGRFHISGIPVGTYSVRISMIGYQTIVRTSIVIAGGTERRLNASLSPAVLETDVVQVVADYFEQPTATEVSVRSLHKEEIRRAPGAAEDIQRVVMAMPGVVNTDDHRNDLMVRGGSPAENLIRVDDIDIPNISHFGTQGATGGPINMLDADYLDKATFMSGGFPAEYGRKLSSVLDVSLREGHRRQYSGSLDLSMAGAGGALEGPIPSTGNDTGAAGSWFVGIRRSYLDLLHNAIDLTAVPQYAGGQAKVVYDLGPSDFISATGLAGWDNIHFERDLESDEPGSDYDVETGGTMAAGGLTWRHIWGRKGYSRLTFSAVSTTYRTDARDISDELDYRNRSRETALGLRFSGSWQVASRGNLGAGIGLKQIDFRHDILLLSDENPLGELQPGLGVSETAQPVEGEAYVQYSIDAGLLSGTGGLRFDYFSLADVPHAFSPRLSARYQITPSVALTTAWGVYHQHPALLWYTATPNAETLKAMRSLHHVAGLEFRPRPTWKVTVEAYTKRYNRIPVFVDMPMLSTINEGSDYGAVLFTSPLIDAGKAHAEGLEFFAQRRLTDVFYTTASYALSRSRYTALDGQERPTNFDMRHVATLVFGTRGFSLPGIGEIGGSLQYRYASGRPYSPVDVEKSLEAGSTVIDPALVNTRRLEAYSRLDVRLDLRENFKWGALTSYVELQNVFDRRNEALRAFNDRTGEVEVFHHWGRFFIGGFILEI